MDNQLERRHNLQKWINVALCAIAIFFGLGFCSSNKSLYLKAITEALGFSRSSYALATSCRFLSTAIINIFFGYLVKKFGTKKLIIAGFFCLMASVSLNIVATNVYMFCVSEIVAGIGFSWTSTGMVGCVINRWCKENTGTITGAVLAANGIGGAVAAQIVTPIIYEAGNPFGYRNAYRFVILLLVVVVVLILLFFKENPPDEAGEAQVNKNKKSSDNHWVGISYDNVKKKKYFYGSIVCIFLTGMCLNSVSGTSSTYFLDLGMNTGLVATVTSISSLALTGSKLFTGFIYDRFGLKKAMTLCMICSIATMFMLSFTKNTTVGVVFAFINAVLTAVALPLETVMLPLYADDLFGDKSYNKIMGIVISANTFGYAVGSPLINFCYDMFGSYAPAYFMAGIIMIVVLCVTHIVINSAHRTRNMIIAKIKVSHV